MAAPESTKFQVNYKLADGTLLNIYAISQAELEASLTSLSDLSTLITTTANALGATSSGASAISYAKKALGASAVTDTSNPDCKHGAMAFRSGVGQKGPWKGWMCAAPKGAADKCDTVWVK